MQKTFLAIALLWSSLASAKVINVEFNFTPYTGDVREDHVQSVPGKAKVFINHMLYAEQDVDKLFAFLQHCKIDLAPLSDTTAQLPDLIASHFYLRPGVYDIERLGQLFATFPPVAARIRELEAEKAARG